MTTPLTTIADALIEFILSLLRDPAAAAAFESEPEATLERSGLGKVCAADVQAVKPVIIDHPQVQPRPDPPRQHSVDPGDPPDVVKAITTVTHQFHIDNRSTIIDQSVNQSIWAHGDVTQIFDQHAIIASGDGATAAGRDVDHSTTNTTIGDVSIGNTDTNVDIDGSFNDSSTNTSTDIDATIIDSGNDSSSTTGVDASADGSFNDTATAIATSATVLHDDAGATDAGVLDADAPDAFAGDAAYDDGGATDVEPSIEVAFDEP